jgi:hypothetical protein
MAGTGSPQRGWSGQVSDFEPDKVVLTPEQKRRQRSRSIAIALALGALVLLFYFVTIVKLGPGVLRRPL